jgi:hypothetical protein
MRLPRTVIHIGANKTGSTTLQRGLFAANEGLLYLGEDCDGFADHAGTLQSLVSDDDVHYREKEARDLFDAYRQRAGDRTFLYSNEDITTSRVPALCARRLHDLMPGSEILMVIRNQLTAIPSWYANHGAYLKQVPRRYWRRFVSFDDWMDHCFTFLNYSPLDGFFYHRILGLYERLFGSARLHVLLYEDFVTDPRGFLAKVCRVLGIDPGSSMESLNGRRERRRVTMREHRYHRFRGWFLPGTGDSLSRFLPFAPSLKKQWLRFLAGGPPADGFMSDTWRRRLVELYQQDNARLARDYGLPLEEHGYPVLSRSPGGDGA